jgi:catechol 2,3-dioxygenase-like lactoylglutathione lyase family enzyme
MVSVLGELPKREGAWEMGPGATDGAAGAQRARSVAGEHVKGLHHIGIPVRSIERSLAWYGRLLGLEPDFLDVAEGPPTNQIVQLDDVRLRFAFLPLGDTMIELLEYERPLGRDFELRNCDVGAVHVCFEVDDIERVHALLTEQGVEFSIGPTLLDGAVAGHRCCYFRDPDGIQLEIWERPAGGTR